MMQQLASSSPKPAVSSLPFDMATDASESAKSVSILGETRSTFEKAMADANEGAFAKAKASRQNDFEFRRIESDKHIVVEAKPGSINDKAVTQPVVDEPKAQTQQNDVLESDKSATLNAASEQGLSSENDNAQAQDIAGELTASNSVDTLVTEPELNTTTESDQTFDYINFVTQVQTLSEQSAPANALGEGIEQNEQALDLSNISLTQDELQVILDAQQAGVDLQNTMNQEQLDKLAAAINKMLNQYREQSADTQHAHTDIDTDALEKISALNETSAKAPSSQALDEALMATIIQQGGDVEAKGSALAAQAEQALLNKEAQHQAALALKSADENAKLTVEQNKQANTSSENTTAFANSSLAKKEHDALLETSVENAPNIALEEAALLAKSASDNQAQSSETKTNAASAAPIAISVKTHQDDAQDALKQLAALEENSLTNTIENIKSRVEKFSADLASAQKGSEFVAAMQSGLKEFKQQLESGREPGIDLKALVSDALAQANVDIPPQNQPKVDSALTQFANILNLANSVNQSAQAQSHQLFGLTETQFVKESNVLHAEGTKLAQQNPTNLDKAVNIFKPEGQQQLAEKVRWMVNGRNPAAEIRLDPPELGAMQIRVNLSGDAASVSFTVQSMAAKEALDQAVPKLRDMLQEQGIELGQSSVQQESKGQSNEQGDGQLAKGSSASHTFGDEQGQSDELGNQVIEQRVAGSILGGIDYYA